jgi:hypothetical protein
MKQNNIKKKSIMNCSLQFTKKKRHQAMNEPRKQNHK